MCILNLLKLHVSTRSYVSSLHRKNRRYYRKNPDEPKLVPMFPEFMLVNSLNTRKTCKSNEGTFEFETSMISQDYWMDCSRFHEKGADESKR